MRYLLQILIVTIAAIFTSSVNYAQDFSQLKQVIDNTRNCRIASITSSGVGVMITGTNGYATLRCPVDLDNRLKEVANAGHTITDVQITESGAWVLLFGANGFIVSGIPQSLNTKLQELNRAGHTFLSVTLNDSEEWAVVTTTNIYFSDSDLGDAATEDMSSYGNIHSVFLNDDAMIVIYANGYGIYGEVPATLKSALSNSGFNPTHITLAGSKWLISDNNGSYNYNM